VELVRHCPPPHPCHVGLLCESCVLQSAMALRRGLGEFVASVRRADGSEKVRLFPVYVSVRGVSLFLAWHFLTCVNA
jgi:hypothetical protein